MGYFLLYQILPLAALWIAFSALARIPSFRVWGVPAVFAAGAVLQLALWRHSRPDLENPDSLGFFRLGHGLETDLRTHLFRPKLYPWFLGLFHGLKTATFWQCALKLGMAGMLVRFSRLCGWKPATSAFALFLFLFSSLWLMEPLRIFDTTLFAFLFAAVLVLAADNLVRYSAPKFTALCLAAGLTALTRQAADLSIGLAMLVVIPAIFYRAVIGTLEGHRERGAGDLEGIKRLFRPVGLSLAAGLLIAGIGAWYNGSHFGTYRRSVALGINLYTHAAYYQLNDPRSREWDFVERFLPGVRRQYPPWETGYAHDMPWSVNALPHRLERKMGTSDVREILEDDRIMRERSVDWAMAYPGRYLASFANESARLLGKCEEMYPASLLDPDRRGPDFPRRFERGVIHQPLWLLLAAGLAVLAFCRRNRFLLLVPALAAVSYLALVAAVQIGLTRYALPAYLPLLMLAGEAADRLPFPSPRPGPKRGFESPRRDSGASPTSGQGV
jgi:hypothetical protein